MDPCSNRSPRHLLVTCDLYIVLIRAPRRSGTSSRMRRGWGDNLIGYSGDASLGRFYGGAGNDTVQSRDVPAVKDTVNCGSGTDTGSADKADIISDVRERVKAW